VATGVILTSPKRSSDSTTPSDETGSEQLAPFCAEQGCSLRRVGVPSLGLRRVLAHDWARRPGIRPVPIATLSGRLARHGRENVTGRRSEVAGIMVPFGRARWISVSELGDVR
jgi:hypothetical protein